MMAIADHQYYGSAGPVIFKWPHSSDSIFIGANPIPTIKRPT